MSPARSIKISRAETLSFLLTYIVVEKGIELSLTQMTLFQLSTLAQEAADKINTEDDIIPHEVIEELAEPFIEAL